MKDKKPETKAEWALCRAELSCKCGMDAMDQRHDVQMAIYNILGTLKDVVTYLQIKDGQDAQQ
jgi:hypothetical protein